VKDKVAVEPLEVLEYLGSLVVRSSSTALKRRVQ